jgi:hypothetical protein
MAPSTPPPPRSAVFAALAIASTACRVMSPCTSSIDAFPMEMAVLVTTGR